jgi:dienelactone hydrolase
MRGALLAAALALAACSGPIANVTFEETVTTPTLRAADGVSVFTHLYAAEKPKALILLFHQAGSSKDEYATIGPRLAAAGYSALAIDQRSGGGMFGPNETVKALGGERDYLEAKRDLDAAIAWAGGQKLPVILWGSSYSSSLAFLAAAEHPEAKALLAFSPDEYFDGKPRVADAARKLAIPVFVTSAQDAEEIAAARALLAAVPGARKRQFVPVHGGVHGSSILIPGRNPKGAEEAWQAVLAFLDEAVR